MTTSDRLLEQLAAHGDEPDYSRLAADVLGIRGAPPALARKLVEQALLVTDWRERWRTVGARAVGDAPARPGVYIFRDRSGRALYVGKAAHLRRRLSAHFADRKWKALPPALARVETVECEPLGSELEALLREAELIRELAPVVNVQTAAPSLDTRAIAPLLIRDVVLLLPSVDPEAAVIVAASVAGSTMIHPISRLAGEWDGLATQLQSFFAESAGHAGGGSAPLVFSWLAGRGHHTTRVDPHDFNTAGELAGRLARLLSDPDLFSDRIVAL